MTRLTTLATLIIFLISVSAPAQDPKAKLSSSQGPMGTITGDQIKAGTYTGKLLSLPNATGEFTLEITSKVTEPKPNAQTLLAGYQKFQNDYQYGLNNIQRDLQRDPRNAQYHLNRLRDHQNWYARHLPNYQPGGSHYPFIVKEVTHSVDFRAAPNMEVRVYELPPEFDENGAIKKRSSSELRKLKGSDPQAPGYEATKEDLNTGALVKITLSRVRRSKDNKDDIDVQARNHVTQIMILSKDGSIPESLLKKAAGTRK
jgi:hypothetical protein